MVEVRKAVKQDPSAQSDRYPKLHNASYSVLPDAGRKVVEELPVQKIRRKKVSSSNLNKAPTDRGGQRSISTPDSVDIEVVDRAPISKYSKAYVDEPRQMRTSSLRAELAAAAQEQRQAVPTVTDWAYKQISKKTSRNSLHPPTNFVAGRRRPAPKRPDSRGSTRGIEQPGRPAPSAPVIRSDKGRIRNDTNSCRHRSSIPIYRAQVSQGASSTRDGEATSNSTNSTVSVFEDAVSTLDTIQGSPAYEYQTKRLSMTSPNYGPILRISHSAEDVIMGTGSDKENDVPARKEKVAVEGPTLTVTNCAYPSSTKTWEKPLVLGASKTYSMDAEPALPSNSQNRAKSHSASLVNASVLEDPFIDQPAMGTSEDPATEVSSNPFKSVDNEHNAGVPTVTISLGSSEEGESGISSDREWISPVARKARTMSTGHVKPMLENYSPSVPPKENSSCNDALTESKISDTADGSKISTLSKPSNIHKPSILSRPSDSSVVPINTDMPITPQTDADSAGFSDKFPMRSSSRMVQPAFGSFDPKRPELISPSQSAKVFNDQAKANSNGGHGCNRIDLPVAQVKSRPLGRDSTALESTKSQGSLSKKGVISNIRGLFQKRSTTEAEAALTGKTHKKGKKASSRTTSTPVPPMPNVHPACRPTVLSSVQTRERSPFPRLTQVASPPPKSPVSSQVSSSTTLAMQILESARNENSSPRKEKLLELGKIMVETITQARDAEKAMEEARYATRKAELAHAQCTKSVGDVARCVVNLRKELVANRLE